jgi:metal-responsive CopG/Arc/MetJ family transcriptional regulator
MRKSKACGFSLPKELMDRIDKDRGDISRSRYILRLLEKHWGIKSGVKP